MEDKSEKDVYSTISGGSKKKCDRKVFATGENQIAEDAKRKQVQFPIRKSGGKKAHGVTLGSGVQTVGVSTFGVPDLEPLQSNQRVVTAIHEAGHCLAHLHLGVVFEGVELAGASCTLVNPRFGTQIKALGAVYAPYYGDRRRSVVDQYPECLPSALREAELQMAIAYAGPAAEARCLHRRFSTVCLSAVSEADLAFVGKLGKLWWADQDRESKYMAAERLARKLVRSDRGWEVICKIADLLSRKDRLSDRECWNIYVEVTGRDPVDHSSPGWRLESL